jgi:hypothetical protein
MRTEPDATPPELIVDHSVAAVAEGRETKVEPRNEDERRGYHEKDGRGKAADRSASKQEEKDTRGDSQPTMNPAFPFRSACSPKNEPTTGSEENPRDEECDKGRRWPVLMRRNSLSEDHRTVHSQEARSIAERQP